MVICPQCNIKHDPGEEFCRKCGKFLLAVEDPSPDEEKTEVNLICPRCQVFYEKGSYCRKCGSLLVQRTAPHETNGQPLEKRLVKRFSKEWLDLWKEKEELESCMSKLEAQSDRISSDVINPLFAHYRDRLESLLPLHQEIEKELESIKKRASGEIDFLENKLKPVQKRLEEFQSLYKQGAVMKVDFLKEKKELRKRIKSIERSLRKFRHILSLLPGKMEEEFVSPRSAGDFLRPLTLMTASVIILLIIAGGYFLWPEPSPSSREIPKEMAPSPAPPAPPPNPAAVRERDEGEKIGALFENIRQANLRKNIDLFMSCFSRDFNGMEGKRQDTLKMWENFSYQDLSYDLKKQTISGDTANVRLEWLVRTSKKEGGKLNDGRSVLDVTLKREEGHWKIKEIHPIS
jgi:DNA-directed RNA polymerase subunit M/transcription elongation factor TFIIS/ketosteroid isomerase-like protein